MCKLDTNMIFTPKGYYEIAGRGIEYIWGITKILFRKKNAALNNEKWVK